MDQIRINGVIFGEGCVRTIKVALISFQESLKYNVMLNDQLGKEVTSDHLENIHLILRVMEDEKDE